MARSPEALEYARASAPRRDSTSQWSIPWGRLIAWSILGGVVMVGSLFAWRRTEEFLIQDDRFRIPEADYFTGQSPNLQVEGVHYASSSQVRDVFAPDVGRSLYLLPIEKRRQQLLAIDWVEEASVSKIWPHSVIVRVHERVPVAFVQLAPAHKGGLSQFALIDKDGVILRPRVPAKFTLPLITGVREQENPYDRRARVRRVLELLKDLGSLAASVSDVDASDPSNLVVSEKVEGRVLSLMLGDENYKSRVMTFTGAYPQIKTNRPDATTFDLRVDGDIGVWGADKSSLGDKNSVN
ncbi:MAG: FtsQ-type POTRA domain-containing protein [Bryobacteraceae bacterium]